MRNMPRKPTEPQKMENLPLKAWAQSHSTQKHQVEKCMEWSEGNPPTILKSLLRDRNTWDTLWGLRNWWEQLLQSQATLQMPLWNSPSSLLAQRVHLVGSLAYLGLPLGFTARSMTTAPASWLQQPPSGPEASQRASSTHQHSIATATAPPNMKESKNTKNCKRLREQLYTNKLDNLEEMGKFLEACNLPGLNH